MNNIPKEVQQQYQKLKNEYSQILKRYIQLQEERRQNNLVLNNIVPLDGERRTWKVVGGILVQYTVTETINSLKQNVVMLQQALKALDIQMGKRQKQVLQIELKYNLNPSKKGPQEMQKIDKKSGLLA